MEDEGDTIPQSILTDVKRAAAVVGAFLTLALGWAIFAPLTTTFRVDGEISSTTPSHLVQHPQGGRIETLAVSLHQQVEQGDLMLVLDATDIQLRRDMLVSRGKFLMTELSEIELRLTHRMGGPAGVQIPSTSIAEALEQRELQLEAELLKGRATATSARSRIKALNVEIEASDALRSQLEFRLSKSEVLSQKGILPETEVERAREDLLAAEAEVASLTSRLLALEAEANAADLQNQLRTVEFRRTLTDRRADLTRDLSQIDKEIAQIDHAIRRTRVHAPISGMVTELLPETAGTVVAPGATIAAISQPLDVPQLELQITPSYVDQTNVGQTGKLTISSLPARDTPDIQVSITSISDEPTKDPEGNPLYYVAQASIDAVDLDRARSVLASRFHLQLGMPVSVALEGDQTTLWDYLVAPITGIWRGAFQD